MIELDAEVVEREVRIAASPEVIFSFFTDPERAVRWMGIEATLDPRPGGIYRVHIQGPHVASGRYVELIPYSRVVFTWGWEAEDELVRPGSSTVEIALIPDGKETIVRLTHRDLPVAERDGHAHGWDHFLPRLVLAAAGADPGPDPWAIAAGQ